MYSSTAHRREPPPLPPHPPEGEYLNMQTLQRPSTSRRQAAKQQPNTENDRYITAWTSNLNQNLDIDNFPPYYNYTGLKTHRSANNLQNLQHETPDKEAPHKYYEVSYYSTVKTPVKSKWRQTWIIISVSVSVIFLLIIGAILIGFFLKFYNSSSADSSNPYQLKSEPQFCAEEKSFDLKLACQRTFVKNMAKSAFKAYKNYAWGAPELRPISKEAYLDDVKGNIPGLTIIDAMSTFWVMDLKEEWAEGKHWITTQMPNFAEVDNLLRTKEVVLDYLGGLLSVYFLSRDEVFLDKAKEVSEVLKSAFYPATGMLAYKFNPKGKNFTSVITANNSYTEKFENNETTISNFTSVRGDHQLSSLNFLADIGFQQPELIAIANLTADKVLIGHLKTNRHLMSKIEKFQGLYLVKINTSTGDWASNWSRLNDFTVDFFYNIPRFYLQMGSKNDNDQLLETYSQAIDNALEMGLLKKTNNGRHIYAQQFQKTNILINKTFDDYCLLGGALALSSKIFRKLNLTSRAELHLQLAVNITDTCQSVTERTRAKLLPREFNDLEIFSNASLIAPYLAEPYFILFRLTGDSKYRQWAWEHALALYKHARTASGGYSYVGDVNSNPTSKKDYQQATFLSGTLKYLYLIFSESSVLPLDKWIFNTRGHPLPICRTSDLYTKEMCK